MFKHSAPFLPSCLLFLWSAADHCLEVGRAGSEASVVPPRIAPSERLFTQGDQCAPVPCLGWKHFSFCQRCHPTVLLNKAERWSPDTTAAGSQGLVQGHTSSVFFKSCDFSVCFSLLNSATYMFAVVVGGRRPAWEVLRYKNKRTVKTWFGNRPGLIEFHLISRLPLEIQFVQAVMTCGYHWTSIQRSM